MRRKKESVSAVVMALMRHGYGDDAGNGNGNGYGSAAVDGRRVMGDVQPHVFDDGVPHCSGDWRYRQDGQPSQTRCWYCAIDGERHYGVCIPAVRLMAKKLEARNAD